MLNFSDLLDDFYNGKAELGLFTTKNVVGEDIIIEITNDYIKTSTCQKNGWIRVLIYHKDRTLEEIYEK